MGGAGNGTHSHTHTHSVPRDTQGGWSLEQGSDIIWKNVGVVPPLIKSVGYEHREDAVEGERAGNVKHKHTHTHSVLPDTQGRLSLGQGSDTILTHAGVAPTNSINGL